MNGSVGTPATAGGTTALGSDYAPAPAPAAPKTEAELRKEMIDIGRRMYDHRYIVATDGNLSARLGPDRLLITPSGTCKGEITEDDLIITNLQNRVIQGRGKPSSEMAMHLAIYEMLFVNG